MRFKRLSPILKSVIFPGTFSSLTKVGGVVVPSKLSVVSPLSVVLGRREVPVSFIEATVVTTLEVVVVTVPAVVVVLVAVVVVVTVDVVVVAVDVVVVIVV